MEAWDRSQAFREHMRVSPRAVCIVLRGPTFGVVMRLAIELTASRVCAYGVKPMIELLDSQFNLLWEGRDGWLTPAPNTVTNDLGTRAMRQALPIDYEPLPAPAGGTVSCLVPLASALRLLFRKLEIRGADRMHTVAIGRINKPTK